MDQKRSLSVNVKNENTSLEKFSKTSELYPINQQDSIIEYS